MLIPLKRVMPKRGLILAIIAFVSVLGISCRPRAENAKRYPLKGKVIAVDKAEHTATIDHEDIGDYMKAMQMEFEIRDDASFAKLEPGDQVTATLVVTDTEDWVENLIITKPPVPDPNAKAGAASVEPQVGAEIPDFALTNQDGKRIQ